MNVVRARRRDGDRQIWPETTFKVGNAAVGVTSLTTFRHCFPCERQTGLIASTSDLFQLAVCNWLPLCGRLSPAMQPLMATTASRKIPSRGEHVLPARLSPRLINPTIISRNRDDVQRQSPAGLPLAHPRKKEGSSSTRTDYLKVRFSH